MPFLLVPKRFTAQPQYAAPLAMGNSLVQHIEQAYFPAGYGLRDVGNNGRNLSSTGASISPCSLGPSFKTAGNTGSYFNAVSAAISVFTIEAYYVPAAAASQYICGTQDGVNNITHDRELWIDSSGKFVFYIYDGATKKAVSATSAVVGTPYHLLGISDGSNIYLYVNGILEATIAAGTAYAGYSTPTFVIGSGSDEGGTSFPGAGWLNYVLRYNKALSPTEARSRYGDKFSLLQAPPRRLWVVPVAGAVSGTLARTNANDTLAASGTTTVIGTLAKTNASDTSTASGTTTVKGTLAKTNANDSVSASGSIGSAVTGTLSRTNANDTAAASGTTTVKGSLARTNANDTASASGTTTVSGSLAKTNANDSSAASGTTTVIGSLAKTNANDSVSASGTVTTGSSGTLAYTNKPDTSSATGTTKILGSLAKTNANDSLAASGIVNSGIIVESSLTDGITTAVRIKKPGVPTGTPEWLKTTIEIVLGRRGNKITSPAEQSLTFSATPTKAECEALYQYTNTVRTAISDLINRLDS